MSFCCCNSFSFVRSSIDVDHFCLAFYFFFRYTPVEKTTPGSASDDSQEFRSPQSFLSSNSLNSQDPAKKIPEAPKLAKKEYQGGDERKKESDVAKSGLTSYHELTPESTTHLRSLSGESFFVFDTQGNVEHVSDHLHAATETRKGEFVGMCVIDFLLQLTGADADDESRRINMIVFFENAFFGGTEIISVVTGSGDETTPMSLRITDSTGVLEVVDYKR